MKYPKISAIKPRPRNTSAKCKCGKLGVLKVEIQINYMRGDDISIWSCEDHKRECDYLLNTK